MFGQGVVELSVIEYSITLVQRPVSEGLVDSWALMLQRGPLYDCVAGVERNNPLKRDPESVKPLWKNLPSCSGIASTPFSTVT